MMCLLCIGGIDVHAESTKEVEPNNSKEEAQLIQANAMTAAERVITEHPNEHAITGYTKSNDADWFKVYLKPGTQYVTCNGNPFQFEVYASNGNLILNQLYTCGSTFGVRAYAFTAYTAGYYYVKVTGTSTSSSSYILLVGGPVYEVAKCKVQCQKITMANGRDEILNIDLSKNSFLPEQSLIYSLSVSNVGLGSVDGIAVTNLGAGTTLNLPQYTWDKNDLVKLNWFLKSNWRVKFTYSKNKSFTPLINLSYVYPVTDVYVDSTITVNP